MPTPMEILLDPISLVVIALYVALMLWEAIFPARKLPVSRAWRFRGMSAFVIFFFLSTYLPLYWDSYLLRNQLFDLSSLGTVYGAIVGLLVYEFAVYVWHRSMHAFDPLWKVFHQMHHSAERLDTYGAFYFSPMDMLAWSFLGSLCLTLLVGFEAQAVTLILLLTTFFSIFQHANIRTPMWLGYFVQRPESHSVHHGKGIHANNYSDLPVFDLLFGTFVNPSEFQKETGFYPGASERVVEMMLFKDVSQPAEELTTAQAEA